jgi:hypothetical protein
MADSKIKITPILTPSYDYSQFVQRMAQLQRDRHPEIYANPKPRPRPVDIIQCASTQAIIDRDPSKDEEWQNRPMSTVGQTTSATPLEDLDKLIPMKVISEEERSHIEAIRKRAKNSQGTVDLSATTPEQKERAQHAFQFSPSLVAPSEKELQRLQELKPYQQTLPPLPIEEVPVKKSLASRFTHWLWKKGVKVDKLTKNELSVEKADEVNND